MPGTAALTGQPSLVSRRSFIFLSRSSYLSILRVDAGQVDLGCELDLRRCVGVVWAAMDRYAVDAVLVDTLQHGSTEFREHDGKGAYMRWTEYSAVPV